MRDFAPLRSAILSNVRMFGFHEPFDGIRRRPHEIDINEANLHETISFAGVNSRKRALLVQLQNELAARGWTERRDLRILGAEALSRIALKLRGEFPYFYGSEYLPEPQQRERHFPLPHMDLQDIPFADESFDIFVSGDILEYIPDMDRAIREVARVLKPGGVLICSCSFSPSREKSEERAVIDGAGEIRNILDPEYHANPVDPARKSLLFRSLGWDILDRLASNGFDDCYFTTIASSHFGIASEGKPGPFVLTAAKSGVDQPRRRPHLNARKGLPEKLVTLTALPRSGTTVITSMLAVHSRIDAIFEPWNAKLLKLEAESDATVAAIGEKAKLGELTGRILLVKETAARDEYINAIQRLYRNTPSLVERHHIVLIRDPYHTLLSEVERRNEWWGDNVELNEEFLAKWRKLRGASLINMLNGLPPANGIVMALEAAAENP
ncbi:MAG: methyltransferase domain-containing protein, partial [Hyphomicrobiales bacterium]|nr:methyltransferase domain-containing protein [Hyphomicrobiales bacterium]